MASKDYLELCEEAQKKKLRLMKTQEKQIKQIYNDMYLNISKKLKKVNPDTLTKRYLEELKKELEKEIRLSNNQVKKIIKNNIEKSSELANNVQLDFFISINDKYNLNMRDTFSSMFSKIPKDAINEILFGKAYKDRKGLSERIWLDTKKFNKDIDYIIAEGIANKKSTYEIAKDLEKYVNPKASKDWEWSKVYPNTSKVVDYNAQRLARTSVQHAFQQAQKRSCKKNPYVEHVRWLSSNSSRTCELCNSRNNQLYEIKDVPLDHPNGLCTTIPEISKSIEEIGEEFRAWIDGETNTKLDKWFEKHGEEFAGTEKVINNNSEKAKSFAKDKKDKEVDYLQSLTNKGVKIDLDSFKNIDKRLFKENSEQLNKLFEKYPKAQDFIKNASFAFKAEKLPNGVIAMCGNNFKSGASSISLDVSNYKDYGKYIEQAKGNIKAGWNSKCIDKYLSATSITHEFGHFIHNIIIDEYNKNNPTEFEKAYKSIMSVNNTLSASKKKMQTYRYKIIKSCNKEIIKEAKKLDKNFDPKENIISKYGNSSPAEFFAECFAEYECDGTTIYAKAMEEFLKKRGFIK